MNANLEAGFGLLVGVLRVFKVDDDDDASFCASPHCKHCLTILAPLNLPSEVVSSASAVEEGGRRRTGSAERAGVVKA